MKSLSYFAYVIKGFKNLPLAVHICIVLFLPGLIGPRFSSLESTETWRCHQSQYCLDYEIKDQKLFYARSKTLIEKGAYRVGNYDWAKECQLKHFVLLPTKQGARVFCLKHGWPEYAKDPFTGPSPHQQLIDLGVVDEKLLQAACKSYQPDGVQMARWCWHLRHTVGSTVVCIADLIILIRLLIWLVEKTIGRKRLAKAKA